MKLVKLSSTHNRDDFFCGIPILDSYIKERATQDIKRAICAVYVLLENNTVIGFYTLCPFTMQMFDLPSKIAKKYPEDLLLPCWLIGRLAVDEKFQKQGIGKTLLKDALERIIMLFEQAGGYCVVVDSKDEDIKSFYIKYGFIPIQEDSLRLYLPVSAIAT